MARAGLPPRLIVDCSHGNSGKDYRKQPEVAASLAQQIALGSPTICGVMLESHLVEGNQGIGDDRNRLRYGQSVTDGCIGWDQTQGVLERSGGRGPAAAQAVRLRRSLPGARRPAQTPMSREFASDRRSTRIAMKARSNLWRQMSDARSRSSLCIVITRDSDRATTSALRTLPVCLEI